MSSEWPTLLTMIVFLVKSLLNVEIGNLQPWTAPELNRPLSVTVSHKWKESPRNNELMCLQLFCCLLWALVPHLGVWLSDGWMASHSLALGFREWSIQRWKSMWAQYTGKLKHVCPAKVVKSTDFEAGRFSPSQTRPQHLGSRLDDCMQLPGGSLSECLLHWFEYRASEAHLWATYSLAGLVEVLGSHETLLFSIITDLNYVPICGIILLTPGFCTLYWLWGLCLFLLIIVPWYLALGRCFISVHWIWHKACPHYWEIDSMYIFY